MNGRPPADKLIFIISHPNPVNFLQWVESGVFQGRHFGHPAPPILAYPPQDTVKLFYLFIKRYPEFLNNNPGEKILGFASAVTKCPGPPIMVVLGVKCLNRPTGLSSKNDFYCMSATHSTPRRNTLRTQYRSRDLAFKPGAAVRTRQTLLLAVVFLLYPQPQIEFKDFFAVFAAVIVTHLSVAPPRHWWCTVRF